MRHRPLIVLVLFALACHRTFEQVGGEVAVRDPGAEVAMYSPSGEALGTLRLQASPTGSTRLLGTLRPLAAGRHGIHLHAVGRCDGPAFESAGAHFNPSGRQHGLENPDGPHGGDALNIEADASLHAAVDVTFARATLDSGSTSGLYDADGAAVVVHAQADDQKTDPSGNSGARIACGVVVRR